MIASTKEPTSAEKRWGYRFGIDGLVSKAEAMEKLAIRSDRTLRRYDRRGLIRVGYRIPGVPGSGVVVCKRSLTDHLAACEK